jgi:tRNA A37 threonylcarbamoyladenosine modification protein TsaB
VLGGQILLHKPNCKSIKIVIDAKRGQVFYNEYELLEKNKLLEKYSRPIIKSVNELSADNILKTYGSFENENVNFETINSAIMAKLLYKKYITPLKTLNPVYVREPDIG